MPLITQNKNQNFLTPIYKKATTWYNAHMGILDDDFPLTDWRARSYYERLQRELAQEYAQFLEQHGTDGILTDEFTDLLSQESWSDGKVIFANHLVPFLPMFKKSQFAIDTVQQKMNPLLKDFENKKIHIANPCSGPLFTESIAIANLLKEQGGFVTGIDHHGIFDEQSFQNMLLKNGTISNNYEVLNNSDFIFANYPFPDPAMAELAVYGFHTNKPFFCTGNKDEKEIFRLANTFPSLKVLNIDDDSIALSNIAFKGTPFVPNNWSPNKDLQSGIPIRERD